MLPPHCDNAVYLFKPAAYIIESGGFEQRRHRQLLPGHVLNIFYHVTCNSNFQYPRNYPLQPNSRTLKPVLNDEPLPIKTGTNVLYEVITVLPP